MFWKEFSWPHQVICPWIETRCVLMEKLPFTSFPMLHAQRGGWEGNKLWVCVTEMSGVCSTTSVSSSPFCLSAMAMPSSILWAVDIFGRVYTLSTVGQYWELCKDAQLEFKRVSAVKQCCWGIACDHQVYTNVFSGDVPIRYQEETYENQVWHMVTCHTATCSSEQSGSKPVQQLSLHVFLTGRLALFSCFDDVSETWCFWRVHMCQIAGCSFNILILEGCTSLLLPKATPVYTTACFVQAIADWNIHPFHLMFSLP